MHGVLYSSAISKCRSLDSPLASSRDIHLLRQDIFICRLKVQIAELLTHILLLDSRFKQVQLSSLKIYSSYGVNTLGPLCLWQCFIDFSPSDWVAVNVNVKPWSETDKSAINKSIFKFKSFLRINLRLKPKRILEMTNLKGIELIYKMKRSGARYIRIMLVIILLLGWDCVCNNCRYPALLNVLCSEILF